MGLARAHAIALVGVQGHPVEIEVDIENGMVALLLVGLPDAALREARDRIRSAIVNSGETWPTRRITVGLSPASLPKRGSGFDLGIAMAILAAAESVPAGALHGLVLIGELGLDGRVRPVPGVLPAAAAAAAAGFDAIAVATENAAEAALVPELRVIAAPSLSAFTTFARNGTRPGGAGVEVLEPGRDLNSLYGAARDGGRQRSQEGSRTAATDLAAWAGTASPAALTVTAPAAQPDGKDLADLVGQPLARRAAEICAAGGHHLMLLGPPGCGKTMLAERIPTVLPRLDPGAALEVSAIHSVAGTLPQGKPLLIDPPFCAPHHTSTRAAIVGGGSGIIKPGAASLAHHGCLFLDEAPEFGRDVLDALRQPLESGEVVLARAGVTARFPARFTMIMAANPCACASASAAGAACSCTPLARRRYLARLSGPLLDRVDAKIEFLPVRRSELLSDRAFTEPSAVVAARVSAARQRAAARLGGTPWRLNAEIPGSELRRRFAPSARALAPLERAMDLGRISARGADRVIRLSWTLADLAGQRRPGQAEVGYGLGLWLGAPP
jgi:magnesium chelatase family protein